MEIQDQPTATVPGHDDFVQGFRERRIGAIGRLGLRFRRGVDGVVKCRDIF